MGLQEWWRNRGRDVAAFPHDENGDVLWGMQCAGDDLGKARDMDFFFTFPHQSTAEQFSNRAGQQGYRVAVTWYENKQVWDATCTIRLTPTHAHVSQTEHALTTTAQALGGSPDGWGTASQ